MAKKALITGINGQMAFWLTKLLLEKNYKVYGTIRRHSMYEHESYRLKEFGKDVKLIYADLLDMTSLARALQLSQPDELYHLAAQSHVAVSFDQAIYTIQGIVTGTSYLLELVRHFYPKTKFYNAASSEIFGNCSDPDGYQRETTEKNPVSPYAISKLFGYHLTRTYRNSFGLFACNGIVFNSESHQRGSNFVTQKIIKGAIEIYRGKSQELKLGSLDSSRDWSHAKDSVKAMWLMMQHKKPDDFVCASGKNHSIKELCEYVFNKFNLDYTKYVVSDKEFIRPEDLKHLKGDARKLRETLGWKPEYTFEQLIDEMIEYQLDDNKITW